MNTGRQLLEKLAPPVRAVLERCGRIAADRGEQAYLVGGRVRDLVIDRSSDDVDVVVVGDGTALAAALATALGGQLTCHRVFQTARVNLPEVGRFDVATARQEEYLRPGDLPRVRAGDLAGDLSRRDFTINALAIGLNPDDLGRLVDPFDGGGDLKSGQIRFLHRRSFADDPTRMVRALRFALRLGYRLEAKTSSALADGVRDCYLDSISGDRLRRELAKLFQEASVEGPLALAEHGLLGAVHPALVAERAVLTALAAERDLADPIVKSPCWTLVVAALALPMRQEQRTQLIGRLNISRQDRAALLGSGEPWQEARDRLPAAGASQPSTVSELLDPVPVDGLLIGAAELAAADDGRADQVRRYLNHWRWVQPQLGGEDLVEIGCPPGPQVGRLLRRLRQARLDGELDNEAGERRLAEAWVAELGN